jgi:hypothetical protein
MNGRRTLTSLVMLGVVNAAIVGALAVATAPVSAASPPTVSIGDTTVPEGNGGKVPVRIAVRLSDPVATDTLVTYATVAASASPGVDYLSRTARVKIRAGRTVGVASLVVLGDTGSEGDEQLGVHLVDAGAVAIADADGVVTIRDDEGATGIAIGDASVWEGDAGTGVAKLTVVLDAARDVDTIVYYSTGDDTAIAPTDYRARRSHFKVRAGRTAAIVTLTTLGDAEIENDEAFAVTIEGIPSGIVSLLDDDTPPRPPLPDAPADVTLVAGPAARYLTATWSAPASSTPILGYDVEVTRGATLNVLTDVVSPLEFGCGLAVVTDTCTVRVRARNTAGDGPWSAPQLASTWAVPDPPVVEFIGGNTIAWNEPASDRPITHYEVQTSANGSTWVHLSTTTLLHAPACIFCQMRVSAHSEIGFSAFGVVAIAPPGPPTNLVAARDALDPSLIHITWTPPADPGSHPVDTYEVFINGVPQPPTSSTSVDTFLRPGFSMPVQVYARNLAGRSLLPASTVIPT